MELGDIKDRGGYDLKELAKARESLEADPTPEKGFQDVDPVFIQVSDNDPVRVEELEARSVLIEYDENDEPVSVEIL